VDLNNTQAADCNDTTVAVTGAVVGDPVVLGPPSNLTADISVFGYVSAANTVTIRSCNPTGSNINPPSASYTIQVLK
jgi:hypothetical protein